MKSRAGQTLTKARCALIEENALRSIEPLHIVLDSLSVVKIDDCQKHLFGLTVLW